MKRLPALACLIPVLALFVCAQGRPRGSTSSLPTRPRPISPEPMSNAMLILSGKVVADDGSLLTEPASIQSICRGQKRTETHTDAHGNFSFTFGGRFATPDSGFDVETPSRNVAGRPERRDPQGCQLQAELPGFTSKVIELDGLLSGNESVDVGRIVLHRLGNVTGFTISATTAQAPGPARKALEKGQQQTLKGKWADARKSFEKAVSLYPKFAVAWFELGRVQLHDDDPAAARQSFQRSLAADSKYVSPYHGLAQLALRDQSWKELTEVSEKLLALDPVSYPGIWMWNSLAHYYLRDLGAAEKSARRGLEVDTEHRVPKLEYMMGIVLLQETNYPEAARHLQAFLSLTTQPAEVAETQRQLAEIARLSAAVHPSAEERK